MKKQKNILPPDEELISGEEIAAVDLAIVGPEIGDRLVSLRKKKGWNQESLSLKSMVSLRVVKQIEAAEKMMNLEEARRFSLALGVTPQHLIAGE